MKNKIANKRLREEFISYYKTTTKHNKKEKTDIEDKIPEGAFIFGNQDSTRQITIISNPYCESCMALHLAINDIISKDCKIVYLFSAFSEALIEVNFRLHALYRIYGPQKTWRILGDWYESKFKNLSFFEAHNVLNYSNDDYIATMAQLEWITENGITKTPTIFIDGYRLSPSFSYNDIKDIFDYPEIDML